MHGPRIGHVACAHRGSSARRRSISFCRPAHFSASVCAPCATIWGQASASSRRDFYPAIEHRIDELGDGSPAMRQPCAGRRLRPVCARNARGSAGSARIARAPTRGDCSRVVLAQPAPALIYQTSARSRAGAIGPARSQPNFEVSPARTRCGRMPAYISAMLPHADGA